MILPPPSHTQNPASTISNSQLSLSHLYPHPFLFPVHILDYFEANPRHHVITSIIVSLCMSKRREGFLKILI